MNHYFKETQKFTQWWLWLLLAGVGILPVYGIVQQLILGIPFGDKPMSDVGLIIYAVFTFALLVMFYLMRLETVITREEIRVRFYPFVSKRVWWSDVKSAEVVNYGFVGGWGIRLGTRYGTVYNTKGNIGLAIVMKNGRKFCVGTQKGDELREVVKANHFAVKL